MCVVQVSEYQGARTLDSLKDFVKKTVSPPDAVEATDGTDESDSKKVYCDDCRYS